MSHLISFVISTFGFACLCLAMPRHHKALIGKPLPVSTSRLLRPMGFILLAVALLRAMTGLGWAYGAISWFAHMSLAAWLVIAFISWRNHQTT